MSVTGPPGTGPWRVGIAISDTAAGTLLTQGVLAALIARERTGRGQWVHTSLLEAMVSFMDFQAARWLIDGEVPGQEGNQHPTMVPMGAYPTADGYLNVSAHRDFGAVLRARSARPSSPTDPRYVDFASRRRAPGRARGRHRRRAAHPHDRRVGRAARRRRAVRSGARGRRGVRRSAGGAPAPDPARSRTRRAATSTCCARRHVQRHPGDASARVRRPTARTRARCSPSSATPTTRSTTLHASRRGREPRPADPQEQRAMTDRRHRHREDARPRGGRHRVDDLQQPGAAQRDVVRHADRGAAHPRRVRRPIPTCT